MEKTMHTLPSSSRRGWAAAIVEWWRELRLNWTTAQRLDRSDPAEVDRIMAEFVLTLDSLRQQSGRNIRTPLSQLMGILGLDRDRALKAHPVMLREMERVCRRCEQMSRCRTDLRQGWIGASAPAYCPNEVDLRALASLPEVATA